MKAAMGAGSLVLVTSPGRLLVLRDATATPPRRRYAALSGDTGSRMRRLHSHMIRLAIPARVHGHRPIETIIVDIGICLDRNHSNINSHVVSKILIPSDEGYATFILKANTAGGAIVDTVEVLHSGHNRVRGIVRVDLNPHRNACPDFGVLVQ